MVGLSVGHLGAGLGPALASESTFSPDEGGESRSEQGFPRRDIGRGTGHLDDGALALVPDRSDLAGGLHLALGRDLVEELDALLAVDEHRRIETADLVEGEASHPGDDREGGQNPLWGVLRIFGRKGEFARPRTDAQRVEKGVSGSPTVTRGCSLGSDCCGIDRHGESFLLALGAQRRALQPYGDRSKKGGSLRSWTRRRTRA